MINHPTQKHPAPFFTCRLFFCLLISFMFSLQTSWAQTGTVADPDKAFEKARNLAYKGQRQDGRELALRIVQEYPQYLDVKTFIGRTYAWDNDFEKARQIFAEVAAANANTLDNYLAWTDAEQWAGEIPKAFAVIEKGLQHFSENPDLLYRKSKLLSVTGKMGEARLLAQKIVNKYPKHGQAYALLQELQGQLLYNELAAGFTYEEFSKHFTPARYAFVQASRGTALGSVVGRVNHASRSGKQTFQPELELYPKLGRRVYGYLNAAFSDGSLFPRQRYGAELFASLPLSLEASAGVRHLSFGPGRKVTIYTGSVGYYTGNYWLSIRPYITPDSSRTSVSASATVRRYFSRPEHYFSLRIGAGFSPELLSTQTTTGSGTKAFYSLKSQSVTLGYQYPFSKKWAVNGNITIGRQETLFALGEYTANTAASIIVKYRYR